MAELVLDGVTYHQNDDETVLECLLRYGLEAPHSCRSGVCHTCMMCAVSGEVPDTAQSGLKPAAKEKGYFLPCVCKGNDDLSLSYEDVMHFQRARVVSRSWLNDSVVKLCLATDEAFSYRAGQYVHLRRGDGLVRSYSLASLPGSSILEFHIRIVEGGRMSGWIANDVTLGEALEISEAEGDCSYAVDDKSEPLLLVGTGSGLAPLWGVIQDALEQGHTGPIALFHGGRQVEDLYLVDELRGLSVEAANFSYYPCVTDVDEADPVLIQQDVKFGRVNDLALQTYPELSGWHVYLCGNPAMVEATKKQAFLAGASLSHIHSDPFVLAHQPS